MIKNTIRFLWEILKNTVYQKKLTMLLGMKQRLNQFENDKRTSFGDSMISKFAPLHHDVIFVAVLICVFYLLLNDLVLRVVEIV